MIPGYAMLTRATQYNHNGGAASPVRDIRRDDPVYRRELRAVNTSPIQRGRYNGGPSTRGENGRLEGYVDGPALAILQALERDA